MLTNTDIAFRRRQLCLLLCQERSERALSLLAYFSLRNMSTPNLGLHHTSENLMTSFNLSSDYLRTSFFSLKIVWGNNWDRWATSSKSYLYFRPAKPRDSEFKQFVPGVAIRQWMPVAGENDWTMTNKNSCRSCHSSIVKTTCFIGKKFCLWMYYVC